MLLRGLGVEPLEEGFSGALLYHATRNRNAPVKQVQMGKFDGQQWQLFGELITGAVNG